MGQHTTKYYITNDLTLIWPARCLLILYKIKVLFFLLLVESKTRRKKIINAITSALSHFNSTQLLKVFRIFSIRIVNLCPFFLPTSDLSKRDPLQEFQQITGACCLLLPFFFLISRSSEGGFFKEITSHFTSQAEQKLPSNKRLLLTACGRSWQHCWTLGSSTGLQKTPPAAAAAAASDLTRHHSDISSNQSCRREDKMFHNSRGVFFSLDGGLCEKLRWT